MNETLERKVSDLNIQVEELLSSRVEKLVEKKLRSWDSQWRELEGRMAQLERFKQVSSVQTSPSSQIASRVSSPQMAVQTSSSPPVVSQMTSSPQMQMVTQKSSAPQMATQLNANLASTPHLASDQVPQMGPLAKATGQATATAASVAPPRSSTAAPVASSVPVKSPPSTAPQRLARGKSQSRKSDTFQGFQDPPHPEDAESRRITLQVSAGRSTGCWRGRWSRSYSTRRSEIFPPSRRRNS